VNERDLMAGVVDAAEKALAANVHGADPQSRATLTVLRQRIATLRAWQENSNETDRRTGVRVQSCKYCQALIFFAQTVDNFGTTVEVTDTRTVAHAMTRPGSRWVPLEIDPIDSADVLPEWRWIVNFDEYPPVTLTSLGATGPVYVDHRQTCGETDGPKKPCPGYQRRWKANATKVNAGMENESVRAANDLLALQRRLTDREPHDDS
jgi:hypothetical protein